MPLNRGGGNRAASPGLLGKQNKQESTGRLGGKAEDHTLILALTVVVEQMCQE